MAVVSIRADSPFVPSTGGSTGVVATVLDKGGNPLRGVPVTFATTTGQLSQSSVLSNEAGDARTELTTSTTAEVTAIVGGSSTTLTGKVTVTARDLPVVALAATSPVGGAANTSEAGLPTIFTLTPTANAGIRSVRLDFGDGTNLTLGAVPAATTVTHTYNRAGSYTVTATANDAFNFTGTSSIVVNVFDRSTVGVQLQVLSNLSGLVSFSASVTGTVSGSIRTYDWDFGDGTGATTTGPQTSHRYTSTGTFVVRLRVVTTTGQEGFTEITIRV